MMNEFDDDEECEGDPTEFDVDYAMELYLNELEYLPLHLKLAIKEKLVGMIETIDDYLIAENGIKDAGRFDLKTW